MSAEGTGGRPETGTARRAVAGALAQAAEAATMAPSFLNTQPWHWRVGGNVLDLYADRSRSLPVADPDGRLLTMSCGAALHHARVALAAEGWQLDVARFPGHRDPGHADRDPDHADRDPDHLARLTVLGPTRVSADAMRLFQTTRLRHTDRRSMSDTPVPPEAVDAIRHAAEAEGVHLHVVRRDDISALAAAVRHADQVVMADPAWRAETNAWLGGAGDRASGVPDQAIPARPAQTPVPGRDFGHAGSLDPGAGHDLYASYAILFGAGDRPADWLRAGEALSAAWLAAVEHGATLLPMTSAVEVGGTREVLRRILSGLGQPYAAVRIGIPDPDRAGPVHTGRLPAGDVIER